MPTYLCYWPNGDLSIVTARDKDQAIYVLDEVGGADESMLRTVPPGFSLHLGRVPYEPDPDADPDEPDYTPDERPCFGFEGFGERTVGAIEKHLRPWSEIAEELRHLHERDAEERRASRGFDGPADVTPIDRGNDGGNIK